MPLNLVFAEHKRALRCHRGLQISQDSRQSHTSTSRSAEDACGADAAPEDALWAVARFGVRCSTRHLSAYLADARALTLTLEDQFGGMLGEAAVPLAALAAAAKSGSGAGAPVSADVRFLVQRGAAETPDLHGRPVAHAAMQMRIAYPAAGFAATPRSAGLPRLGSATEPDLAGPTRARRAMAPQHNMAGPEEPRRRDALPAPVAWDDAGSTSGAPDSGSSGEVVTESGRRHAVAELQGDFDAPGAGPPGVWWSGELRGWQAQAAPPGQPRAWPQGAYFGAVPLAYLAAWQRQAQAQGGPSVPPAWSRQAPPAQPVFVPPWPAYAPQAWPAPPGPQLAAALQTPAAGPGSEPTGLGHGRAAAPVSAAGAAQGVVTQGLGAARARAGGSGGGPGYPGKGPMRRRRAGSAGTGGAAGALLKGSPGVGGVSGGLRAGRFAAAAAAAAGGVSSSDSSAGGCAAAGAAGGHDAVAGDIPLGVGAPGRMKRARKARPSIHMVSIARGSRRDGISDNLSAS